MGVGCLTTHGSTSSNAARQITCIIYDYTVSAVKGFESLYLQNESNKPVKAQCLTGEKGYVWLAENEVIFRQSWADMALKNLPWQKYRAQMVLPCGRSTRLWEAEVPR
jgi:hypothetical protein